MNGFQTDPRNILKRLEMKIISRQGLSHNNISKFSEINSLKRFFWIRFNFGPKVQKRQKSGNIFSELQTYLNLLHPLVATISSAWVVFHKVVRTWVSCSSSDSQKREWGRKSVHACSGLLARLMQVGVKLALWAL